jgi:hypothetical protein
MKDTIRPERIRAGTNELRLTLFHPWRSIEGRFGDDGGVFEAHDGPS